MAVTIATPIKRRHEYRWHLHQQIHRDQYGNDRATDIHGDDGRVGDVASRHPVANAEAANHLGLMRLAAGDAGDGNIDVAADQTHEQCGESHLGRQAERDECIVDDVNFEQDEKEREDEEEDDRVEGEEGCEDHPVILAVA